MDLRQLIQCLKNSNENYPDLILSRRGKAYTFINPYSYHIYRKQTSLYGAFDGLFVDGISMCWWVNLLWRKKIRRLSFDMSGMAIELFEQLNSVSNEDDIYFIGSRQREIEKSISQIHEAYPNIKIREYRNGYFQNEKEREKTIMRIVALNPSYTVVGMGSPLQEIFALDLKRAGYKGIIFTCGGFLHQTSHKINYYPKWINKYNLRAFYRLYREKGLWGRLYNVLIQFPFLFLLDTIKVQLKYKRINSGKRVKETCGDGL